MGKSALHKDKARRDMAPRLVPVMAVDGENFFYTQDEEICFAFICDPLSGADSHTNARLNALLNLDWINHSALQIILWNGPDLAPILTQYIEKRPPDTREEATMRARFLRAATEKPIFGKYIVKNGQLIFTYKAKLPHGIKRVSEAFKNQFALLRDSFREVLQSVGFCPIEMTPDALLRLYKTMYVRTGDADWRFEDITKYRDDEAFPVQVFDYDTAIELDSSSIRVGEDIVKVLSVKRMPEYSYFGDAMSYLSDPMGGERGIPQNCMISVSIIFPDPEMAKAGMENKRGYVQMQAEGGLAKRLTELSELYQNFNELHQAFADGDRPIQVYLGMSIFSNGENKTDAAAAVSNARTFWRDNGFQLVEDRFITLPAFLNQLPFGVDLKGYKELFRFKTMATRHAIPLLPIFGDWRGTASPELLFSSRSGQIMGYDLFDSPTNYNAAIAAESGSGKSFLTNEIIKSYIRSGGRAWMIDVGRSYEKLCHNLDGQFIVFSKESNICLNPFSVVKDFEEEADMLNGLLQAMAAPTQRLSDLQTSVMRRVLNEAWADKGTDLDIDDIADRLKKENDPRVSDIGKQLFAFTSEGEYGRFFNGKNNLQFDNKLVVLELEELKGKKHLQQVVLLQLIYQIQQEMYLGDRGQRKLMFVDEAWELLAEGDVAKFIESGYRRFRKYGGSAIIITQSINDLYDSPTGRVIAENSAHMFLLGQKASTIDAVEADKRLSLNEGGYSLLKTVRTTNKFSEIFFISPYGTGIGRLIVDEFHKLLYTTNPKEVAALDAYREQGMTVEDAIHRYLVDHSSGSKQ